MIQATGGLFLGRARLSASLARRASLPGVIEHCDRPVVEDRGIAGNQRAALGQKTVLEGGDRLGGRSQHDRDRGRARASCSASARPSASTTAKQPGSREHGS